MDPNDTGFWCCYCKTMVAAWAQEYVGMCADCALRCSKCGGSGLLPFIPRWGMSFFCECPFGQKKLAETPNVPPPTLP